MTRSAATSGRIAGLVYLGVVLTGIFTLAYVPSRLPTDSGAAAAIAANETLFRSGVYAGFAMCAFFMALPIALARFLSVHGKNAARLMIAFVAASIPLTLVALGHKLEILGLISDRAADPALISDRFALHDRWMDLASIFWGLWLAPLGWLILKSGAIPRAFGVLLMLGCAGYLANYFGPTILNGYDDLAFRDLISLPGSIGEIGACLWLLTMGARGPR